MPRRAAIRILSLLLLLGGLANSAVADLSAAQEPEVTHDPEITHGYRYSKPEDVAATVVAILELPQRALVSELDIRPTNP